MTVQELIKLLEGFDPDSEVRLATQPAWPFEWQIGEVLEYQPDTDEPDPFQMEKEGATQIEIETEMEAWTQRVEDNPPIIYLGEGQQLGYLPEDAAVQLGWKLMQMA